MKQFTFGSKTGSTDHVRFGYTIYCYRCKQYRECTSPLSQSKGETNFLVPWYGLKKWCARRGSGMNEEPVQLLPIRQVIVPDYVY